MEDETSPEKYLRQIRDIEMQNRKLLEELVEYKKKEKKKTKWILLGRILTILLPYILVVLLGLFFYIKIMGALSSFESSIKGLVPDVPSISEVKDNTVDFFKNIIP